MPPSTMPDIHTIVMLMLENRALDNLFGHLYGPREPYLTFYPEGSRQQYDGIPIGASNPAYDWSGNLWSYPVLPIPIQQLVGQGDDPSIIPWWDPTEEYLSLFGTGRGVLNQMFGNQNKVSVEPSFGTRPGMLGFLQDYWTVETTEAYGGMDILWTFQAEQLPNLYTVARHGAISDAWFASVPSDTNPNRAYSLLGTSLGRESDQSTSEQFPNVPTIFNALAGAGKSTGLYYTDIWQAGQCYTQYTFPEATQGLGEVATVPKFFSRAAAGTLPAFTYLEPQWGWGISGSIEMRQGTDLHPPTSVTPGDQFVGNVVQALVRSPQWANTLLIITFDEHGGTYDHAGPAWGAINPDGRRSASGFDFNLFGVRVPTILFSPWITPRTVFRAPAGSPFPFDHTSFIKTLLSWAGAQVSGFFNRMPQAPAFDGLIRKGEGEAADHADAMRKAHDLPLTPPSYTRPLRTSNALFEGVGFASVRSIISTSRSPEEVVRKVEAYRRDPEAFEASLGPRAQ